MFKKICSLIVFSIVIMSNYLAAEVEYDIQDAGILQTHSSQAVALNNQGQILGWYNVDGSPTGKHVFLRHRDGSFNEVSTRDNGTGEEINWRFLTNHGKVYGTSAMSGNSFTLYTWDQYNGIVRLATLSGSDVSAVNDAGQVLVTSAIENKNGKMIQRPYIWKYGSITKLSGVVGNIGIESEESYGFAMNSSGEVVGQSLVQLCYKNNIYKKLHAVKWVNGKPIDIHNTIPKTDRSSAVAINDGGDVLVHGATPSHSYIIDKKCKALNKAVPYSKQLNNKYLCAEDNAVFKYRNKIFVTDIATINEQIESDWNSIWLKIDKIISVNDSGDIIAEGTTIYGEQHMMFLTQKDFN